MISNYAVRTRCINELRQKIKPFKWTDECQEAFQSLVDELASEPLIQACTLDKKVTLITDASEKKTISAVITQNDHPLIYIYRNLTTAKQKYSNNEREALAIMFAVT